MEVAKEGTSREKLSRMLLKSVAVGVGRGRPELAHHAKLELLPQARDWGLCVTL